MTRNWLSSGSDSYPGNELAIATNKIYVNSVDLKFIAEQASKSYSLLENGARQLEGETLACIIHEE
ncbi:hypothetical protein NDA01_23575 [Trichocoleus desertorum AS-A10]|uniref:hypothetical protein n=1 Tax=Trichocoleus desertorum TaxID=1481672 RepID=UPI0032968780